MTERDPAAASRISEATAAGQMAAAAHGDVEAFTLLCQAYTPLLMGVALRMVGDRNDAEKAVHEVLVESWRSCRVFDPARFSVRVWWTIGVRTMALRRSKGRRVKRMASTHDTMIAQLGPAVEAADLAELRAKVRRVLDALTGEQRSLLQLAYFDGLSATEVGDRSTMNAGQVRTHLAEALRCIRTGLFWIDAPQVGPADQLAAAYLLAELSPEERAACDLGDPLPEHNLDGAAAATIRDTVHALALYTLPGPAPPRIKIRVHAAITGPDRMQPFAADLARFFAVDLAAAREHIAAVDRPQGWLEDSPGVRLLSVRTAAAAGSAGSSDSPGRDDALDATMVQAPSWPATCLVRIAPGHSLGARYPGSDTTALVLQGGLLGDDGRSARAGETWPWPAGTALGTASPGEVELICAVRAGPAQA
jgi:RNA polymerase sigma-70 factor (ECF subfamily)